MNLSYEDLVAEGKLKKEEGIGIDQIQRFIRRAKKDLETARKLVEYDEGAALSLIYNSMFHAANALIRFQGYRPGNKLQHIGVIEAVGRTLGNDCREIIFKYNKLRVKRNRFEYQAIYNVSKTQLFKDIRDAMEFILLIEKYLKGKNPQLSLDF